MAFLTAPLTSLPTFRKRIHGPHKLLSSAGAGAAPRRRSAPRRSRATARPDSQDRSSRPESGLTVVSRAQQLASRGDLARARKVLRTHVYERPDDARAWLALARLDGGTRALSVYAEGAAHCPRSVHLLHAYAVAAGRLGRISDARRLFRCCLDIAPGDGVVWQAFALLEEKQGEMERAHALFAEGAERDPGNAHLWSAWGAMAQRQRQHDRAVRKFAAAVAILPDHVRTLQMWAISCEQLGNLEESRDLFEQALSSDPRSVPTLQAYALFHARRGNFDAARELFQTACELDPNHAAVYHAWAQMERQEGHFEAARNLFDAGVRADPFSAPMLRAWAAMELQLGHIDKSNAWRVPGAEGRGHRRARRKPVHRPKGPDIAPRERRRQLSDVGKNLQMLRLLIERKSDEDVTTVMKWLDRRARDDRSLYDAFAERSEEDARVLRNWVTRRSQEDVSAFKRWIESQYERDRRIGVYVLNWKIPPISGAVSKAAATTEGVASGNGPVKVPREWYQLAERPEKTLQAADEEVYYSDGPRNYALDVYFLGQIASAFADRAAMVFALGTLSFALLGFSMHLEGLGYFPAAIEDGRNDAEGASEIAPPSGVDAYLYESELKHR